ncbi:unnamed protein product [Polarella glacialis]|uniref:Uncharacterized protein n=1 Tax=Polarella glacialis TaxID=89957 RepID=A0A813FQ98_POLGL|nr:unnamed protein product [Polarella glacialis]CAE8628223.1 unnamed protein product [Polarella glacialis]
MAFWFYSASLPSLIAWPQAIRLALPVVGLSVSLLRRMLGGLLAGSKRARGLRWNFIAAGLLSFPGLLSLVNALLAAKAFLDDWSFPLGLRRAEAVLHLQEVRWWHTLMLTVLILCVLALQRADRFRRA